jgi:hypothetical protein
VASGDGKSACGSCELTGANAPRAPRPRPPRPGSWLLLAAGGLAVRGTDQISSGHGSRVEAGLGVGSERGVSLRPTCARHAAHS